MANILYGVCGQGYGHSSRSEEIIRHLIQQGHLVKIVSHDSGLKVLSKSFPVEEINGLRLDYRKNRLDYPGTLFENLKHFPKFVGSIQKIQKIIEEFNIQLVFTDFEPFSCLLANYNGLPVISFDNHHFLTNAKVSYPSKYRNEAFFVKIITKLITPKANAYLAVTFFEAKAKDRKSFFFPPVIRREIFKLKPKQGGVYFGLFYVALPRGS